MKEFSIGDALRILGGFPIETIELKISLYDDQREKKGS